MQVLVTGGAGFIGSSLVPMLRRAGHGVLVVDNLECGRREHVPAGVPLEILDVADVDSLGGLCAGCDAVVHLAALASVPLSLREPLRTHRANSAATLSVLEAARRAGVPRVILASSAAVYGDAGPLLPETAPAVPRSLYGVDKLAGEMRLRVYHQVFGIGGLSLRFFNLYGPRQRAGGADSTVVPRWIQAMLRGDAPLISGDGRQTRDFIHVDDAARAIALSLSAPRALLDGRAINVASGASVSLLELLDILRAATGSQVEPVFLPARPGDIQSSCADITEARETLGFHPAVPLAQGIHQTVAWYRENPAAGDEGGPCEGS